MKYLQRLLCFVLKVEILWQHCKKKKKNRQKYTLPCYIALQLLIETVCNLHHSVKRYISDIFGCHIFQNKWKEGVFLTDDQFLASRAKGTSLLDTFSLFLFIRSFFSALCGNCRREIFHLVN